jgi:hypothetical protein
MKLALLQQADAQCYLVKVLIVTLFRAWIKNRNKKLSFSPNNSLAKANKTNNYS